MTLAGGPVIFLLLVTGLLVLKFGRIPLFSDVFASGMMTALFFIAFIINLFILLWSVIPANGFFRNMEDVGTDMMQIISALRHTRE